MRSLTTTEYAALLVIEDESFEPCVEGEAVDGYDPDVFYAIDPLETRGLLRDEVCGKCVRMEGEPATHVYLTDLGKLAISLVRTGVMILTGES